MIFLYWLSDIIELVNGSFVVSVSLIITSFIVAILIYLFGILTNLKSLIKPNND